MSRPRDGAAAGCRIRITRRFGASAQRVFGAWMDAALARRWLFATAARPSERVRIDARVGGAFRFVERGGGEWIEYRGAYVDIVRPRRIVFTLFDGAALGRVAVDIATRRSGCRLELLHDDVPARRATDIHHRWDGMLYGLRTIVEPSAPSATRSKR
jgi:uncharacterized protein YndB with AHSA1/START domain